MLHESFLNFCESGMVGAPQLRGSVILGLLIRRMIPDSELQVVCAEYLLMLRIEYGCLRVLGFDKISAALALTMIGEWNLGDAVPEFAIAGLKAQCFGHERGCL